ncbi:MAG: glycoside hydrolase [Bacteroidota bacterium]|nr:glycoside hydrolase [Bacteroidota bacterium]
MKKLILSILSLFILLAAFTQKKDNNEIIIAKGHMPAITKDKRNVIHIVYGSGDSIMYVSSKDGISYSSPALVAELPHLIASATRGPQVAAVANGLIVIAGDKAGNIFSYRKAIDGKWDKTKKVNDINEISKEGLTALSADGSNVFAVWLGVNNPKGQSVYGARSDDGGKTWHKNIIVYASPSGTVCECCKPSTVVSGNNVYVMFRNFLSGNRDLYLTESSDNGKTFGQAQKLGNGSWKLDGCPMDGGGIAINKNKIPETVWRRQGKIYTAQPGKPEKEIGEGRSCSIETINNKNVYTWTEKGNVIVMKPDGAKINMGKGSLPLLQSLRNDKVVCIWENENEINTSVINL